MKVIVDTSIWSLVLRRRKKQQTKTSDKILKLIDESRIVILGPIRQEILSGIKIKKQFELLKVYLKAFPDLNLEIKDYELAAEFFNICKAKGVQGSNTDFLICAVAVNNNFSIYTSDKDFKLFKNYIPIQLENL
ncbi:MAG: PIN domain-containing protein [Bacteroidetes bacterium]|nr:PIN domain-containing protein [Bacteroidota bacterium]